MRSAVGAQQGCAGAKVLLAGLRLNPQNAVYKHKNYEHKTALKKAWNNEEHTVSSNTICLSFLNIQNTKPDDNNNDNMRKTPKHFKCL